MSLAPDQGALSYLKIFFTRMGYVPSLVISFVKQFPNLDNKHSITKFQQATRNWSGYLTYDAGITPGCIKIIIYDQLI